LRIGVFSDVHGNIDALEVVLKALQNESIAQAVCMGDLVGYGPDPNPCVDKTLAFADIVVAGNHDHGAARLINTDEFNEAARLAIEWTQSELTENAVKLLTRLPMIMVGPDFTVVHATPDEPEKWIYMSTYGDIYRSFNALTTPLCLVGHSHSPAVFILDDENRITIKQDSKISFDPKKKYIINVGSVGQPRDKDTRTCYGILDLDKQEFQTKRLPYPVKKVQEKMRKKNLPSSLIERLSIGK